jgi:hypothetical protein
MTHLLPLFDLSQTLLPSLLLALALLQQGLRNEDLVLGWRGSVSNEKSRSVRSAESGCDSPSQNCSDDAAFSGWCHVTRRNVFDQ